MEEGQPPPKFLTVEMFFQSYQSELKLRLVGSECGFKRPILEPTINRPGLALAGFFQYFAFKRIQVIGQSEVSYLDNLPKSEQHTRFLALCRQTIPCLIVSRDVQLDPDLVSLANAEGISVFSTPMVTMSFVNAATIRMEWEFAPVDLLHGCMVEVRGMGVLIQGSSGMGKSECVLALLDRGSSLISDDVVRVRRIEDREIIGTAPEVTRYFLEVRGLGIINVAALFGISAICFEKRLDLIVKLVPMDKIHEVDRIGLESLHTEILGMKVPYVELPVAPGRNMAKLIEVAALTQKLRSRGYEMAEEFSRNLLKKMNPVT